VAPPKRPARRPEGAVNDFALLALINSKRVLCDCLGPRLGSDFNELLGFVLGVICRPNEINGLARRFQIALRSFSIWCDSVRRTRRL
jgi:hypothetical protein